MNRKERAEALTEEYNIEITGRHVLVTDAMKEYATQKISRIERFSDRIIDVMVNMDVQRQDHKVDIVMRYNHIKIKASAVTNDMYISIDQAVHKIETQLLRYKGKLQDHHARGVKSEEMRVNVIEARELDEIRINDEIENENYNHLEKHRPHAVVSNHTTPLKTLRLDEAIMKMELSTDGFLVFRSEEDQKLKVIYRRKDANFGVIEPEL